MPFFRYVARERSGKLIEETIEAASKEELIDSLQTRGLYVVSVGPAPQAKKARQAKRRYHRALKSFDLIMFSRELATLLGAGVPLIKSLDTLCQQIESLTLLRTVEQIKKDIEGGYTFQNALKKHGKVFSEFWVHLVETGETSGHLPLSLEQLAAYLEESAALKKKIVSAMVYPVILICVAIGAIAVFLLKIIPIFSDIFKGFDVPLPVLTQIIISMSNMVKKYSLVVAGLGVALFFGIKKYISTAAGKAQFDALKFKLPVLGPVTQEICTERFASALSTLLKSGVPILHALEIAEKIAGNVVMEKELRELKIAVRDGRGMAQTMKNSTLFSPLVVQMVGVGEEIGELGKMLDRVAFFYKERVNTFVARLTTMFEPMILIFMGVVVGVLVIAMFMPIFSISSAIKVSG